MTNWNDIAFNTPVVDKTDGIVGLFSGVHEGDKNLLTYYYKDFWSGSMHYITTGKAQLRLYGAKDAEKRCKKEELI